jgi:hypothetical protein
MSNYSNLTISCLTLNILLTIFEIITFIISLILLCLIIYRYIFVNYYQYKLKLNIPIILSINTLYLNVVQNLI